MPNCPARKRSKPMLWRQVFRVTAYIGPRLSEPETIAVIAFTTPTEIYHPIPAR